jgi:Acetyltransferase (GNAT) domain
VAVLRGAEALLGEGERGLSHPAELGELAAFRDLYAAAPDEAHVAKIGDAFCLAVPTLPKSAMFNRVLGLGLQRPATEHELDEIAAFFADVEVDYAVSPHPLARPRELRLWLDERGFHTGYAWAKFERGAVEPPEVETDLHVEEVEADGAEDFGDAFVRAYGTPELFRDWAVRLPGREGWHCFVAYDGETPAATGAVFVHGDVGWFGMAGTLPEFRRRGAQNAILAARIRAAAAAGAKTLVTETGERVEGKVGNSYRNIERAGFEFRYVRPNYLSSPDADTSGTR